MFSIPDDYAEELQQMSGACNEIVCLVSPDADFEQVIAEFNTGLDDFGVISSLRLDEQESHFMLVNEIRQGKQMAMKLSSLCMIVAALLLNLLLHRFTEKQQGKVASEFAEGELDRMLTSGQTPGSGCRLRSGSSRPAAPRQCRLSEALCLKLRTAPDNQKGE